MYPRKKLNQNISGGSVFRNAYDQASNIMYRARGGGLEGLKESIDINGQPHNLAYINPTEANLIKVLGGSGQKVNGIPAFNGDWSGYNGNGSDDTTGIAGGTYNGTSISDEGVHGDESFGPGSGVGPGDMPFEEGKDAPLGRITDWDADTQPQSQSALNMLLGRLFAGTAKKSTDPTDPTDPGPFGRATGFGSATPGVWDAAAKDVDNWRSDTANEAKRNYERLENKGFTPPEYTYFNAMKERGMTNAEAQMAVAQAFAIAGEKTMTEHYETGYKYGGPAETALDYLENYAEGHNEAMEAALERGNRERDRAIATDPDEYDLEAYEDEELGLFNLTGLVGKSLVGGDKLNEFQLQAVQDMFPNATITARSDMDTNIGFLGPMVAGLLPGPIGRVWGIANAVAKIFGENIVGWMDRPGMPTMSIRANGDVRYDTDPVATDEDSYQIMTERIIREKPIIEEDLTKEEEEEKNSIADLVGLEGDIVERLSLQNVKNILQSIYGEDYEPF